MYIIISIYNEVVLQGNNLFAGTGHNSEIITDDEGNDWFFYHAWQKAKIDNGRQLIENMCLKAFESISDAENTSKEKYITKTMLIKSSNDMSTQEKLTSLDKNYEQRNHERWQNLLYFAIIPFSVLGVAVASPMAMKNVRKLFTT